MHRENDMTTKRQTGRPDEPDSRLDRAKGVRPRDRILNALLILAGLCLVAMMTLTAVDVAGRAILSRSLAGTTEMVQVALAFAVSLALPVVTWRGAHISLGLIDDGRRGWANGLRVVCVAAISAAVSGWVAVVLWRRAFEALEYEDVIGYLELPVAPMIFALSVAAAAMAAAFSARAIGRLAALVRRVQPSRGMSGAVK